MKRKIFLVVSLMLSVMFCISAFGTPTVFVAQAVEENKDVAITYNLGADTAIINAPTVICDVVDAQSFASLTAKKRPTNAIFHIDENMNVIDKEGKIIDSFINVYNNVIKGTVIPIIYIENDAQKKAVNNFLNNKIYIHDMAIMSDNPTYINYIKNRKPIVRAILDFSNDTTSTVADIVKKTNKNQSFVAVLPQRFATIEDVRYIHARFKTVWLYGGNTRESITSALHTGTYGIISDNVSAVYDVYGSYTSPTLIRSPFDVAHRGLPNSYNECSYSGTEAAIKAGATHIEIDGYVTTDNKIVFMHDNTLDRTSNGTGLIEQKSSTQLKEYSLDLKKEEPIPFFEDIAPLFQDNPNAIMVLEIKTMNTIIVDILKEMLNIYDLWDQVVVISFIDVIVSMMKSKLPEIPCSYLNFTGSASYESVLEKMCIYNCGIDISFGEISDYRPYNERFLRDRGIIAWWWTASTNYQVSEHAKKGLIGLTNNVADSFADLPLRATSNSDALFYPGVGGESFSVKVTTINNNEHISYGKPISIVDCGDSWSVVVGYSYYGANFCTLPFSVQKAGGFTESQRLEVVNVIKLIEKIPTVLQNTQSHNDIIDDARAKYNALDNNLKEQVSNYSKLQSAESKMSELKGGDNSNNSSSSCATVAPIVGGNGDSNGGSGLGIMIVACVLALLAFFVARRKIKN